jgi:hypothetical protein
VSKLLLSHAEGNGRMLGRLEMDVDECITAYSRLAEAVFGEKLSSFPVNIKGRVKARFDSRVEIP